MNRLPANLRNVTGVGLLVVFGALLVYDLLPATNDAEGDTISEVLAGAPLPAVLIAGYLLGHFWPIGAVLRRVWAPPDSAEKPADLPPKDAAG